MSQLNAERNTLEVLAEDFVARYRRGERPGLAEYISAHPELAGEIRELFPTLVMMEELAPGDLDSSMPASEDSAGPPRLSLGDYRILREIGRGGMGIVYEAEQLSLGRRVALKVVRHAATDATIRQRFHREARAAAQLHHTNIVPVFEVGENQDDCWYAMQLILGQGLDQIIEELRQQRQTLSGESPSPEIYATRLANAPRSEVCRLPGQVTQSLLSGQFACPVLDPSTPPPESASRGPLDSSDSARLAGHSELSASDSAGGQYYRSVARIGRQAAEALAYAHARGIIHRDVKPSNFLLDTAGVVWITDFGLAKTQDVALTVTGDIVGTLRYMAPERLRGEGDERGDVYALGLTLYELLVLRPAFEAQDRLQLIECIKNLEPARPRTLDRRIPRDLETIILKAIQKEPKQRYQTAEAIAEDLRRFLADEPIKAKRTSQLARLRLWCRRNPAVASLLATVAGLLVTVAVVSLFSAASLRTALTRTEQAEGAARLREAEALVGQAHGIRYSRRPGQRFEALAALGKAADIGRQLGQPTAWFEQLRNEAIAALALPDIHITHEFGAYPPGTVNVELNDDFTLYARTTETGGCTIRRVADDSEVSRLPELGEPAWAGFGPGGMLAVCGESSHRFQLWDVSGMEPARGFTERNVYSWQFYPGGSLLGLAHLDGGISIYDVAAGTRLYRLAPTEIVRELNLRFHPAGSFLAAFSYHNRVVQVRDLRTGAVVASALPPWPSGNGCGAWSPHGRTLLVPQGDGGKIQEYAFDPATADLRPARAFQCPIELGCPFLAFHPAGNRFIARGWSTRISLFDAVSGQALFSTHALGLTTDHCAITSFDRAGERLAAARVGPRNETIGLWSFAGGWEYRSLVHAVESKFEHHRAGPTVHPGGRLAAVGLSDGVALFDLDTASELAHIPSGNACTQFDGAGNLLTNGFEGFFRWPVRPDPANPNRLLVGPPVRLPFPAGDLQIAASRDGRVVAQSMWAGYGMQQFAGGWILHPNSPTPRQVNARRSIGPCSVSPDGRWVAFAVAHYGVEVYEAATGKRVWQALTGKAGNSCHFSSDGRWLITDVDNGRLYAAGSWEPGPQLGAGVPYDATSDLAVLAQANGIYRLVELATGRELALLEDPEQSSRQAVFTPDGTKLVVGANNGLRVWDLRRIRTELAKLGLDWDAPPLPAASASPPAPLSIHVEVGDILQLARANSLVKQAAQDIGKHEHAKALAALRQAVQIAPGHAAAHNTLAWLLLAGPKELRDPKQALPLARKAVELEPKQAMYANTLGVAHYYTGQFADAIPALERSLREQAGQTGAFDLFFLAMCHHRLGDAAKAKDYLERGKQWCQKNKGKLSARWREELTAFQAEANSVLAQPPEQRKK